ncbi:MAG: hypothetical protein RLZZ44_2083 [Bacteroidota bacterium]|jgi:glycerol-3-phosphate dehydrogenase (NAD(P)+)
MPRVVILGAGVMGSAMAMPLNSAGQEIDLVGTHLDEVIIRSIQGNGFHPKLNITLPESVKAYQWTDLDRISLNKADMIILGVSSAGVDWAIDRIAENLTRPVPIVMITKGLRIQDGEIKIFPSIVSEILQKKLGFSVPVLGIGGPCIAGELAALRDTMTVIGGDDNNSIEKAIKLLNAPYYHARPSLDVIGVEVCAAFKNFFAIGVGWAQGHFEKSKTVENTAKMHNIAAGLFTQSVRELTTLTVAIGGQAETVNGLAGVGDLYVTCLAGRNSRMGRLLGLGLTYEKAKADHMEKDTIEGAELAKAIGPQLELMWTDGRLSRYEMPLSNAIVRAICYNEILSIPWSKFMI